MKVVKEFVLPFCLLNARSVKNKLGGLSLLIDSYDNLPLIALTETFLNANDTNLILPYVNKYTVYRVDKEEGAGGGVCLWCPKRNFLVSLHLTASNPM